jgi:hypothetical protein
MATLREVKRELCADIAADVRAQLERERPGGTPDGDRREAAMIEVIEEMERRGSVVHRPARPTRDAPALPLEHPALSDPEGSDDE